jgi:glycine cleavage system H protein
MSPVTGKIIEANSAVEEIPKLINEGPEAQGWIAKIRVADQAELEQLMDEAAYKASLEE